MQPAVTDVDDHCLSNELIEQLNELSLYTSKCAHTAELIYTKIQWNLRYSGT